MDEEFYRDDPRDYALSLIENGLCDHDYMVLACLKWMSKDDVREMLDANELSPRFNWQDED